MKIILDLAQQEAYLPQYLFLVVHTEIQLITFEGQVAIYALDGLYPSLIVCIEHAGIQ